MTTRITFKKRKGDKTNQKQASNVAEAEAHPLQNQN